MNNKLNKYILYNELRNIAGNDDIVDVVIVGSGLTGSYLVWKLSSKVCGVQLHVNCNEYDYIYVRYLDKIII